MYSAISRSRFMTSRADPIRIGGEFELTLADFSQTPGETVPVLPTPYVGWTNTGRAALLLTAEDILRRGGKPQVWLPAFCCRSVEQAFRQARFEVRYYACAELHREESSPPDPRPGESILFVHYFGHRNELRLAQAAAWKKIGVHVIEDAAQAALTEGIGATGHYVISSLRKYFAQPDGAMVGSQHPLNFTLADADEEFVSARTLGKLMRGAFADPELFLPLIERSESRLDDCAIVPRHPSWLSRQLMLRTNVASVTERRRGNWQSLRGALDGTLAANLEPLFPTIHEGEVPLGLAVRVRHGRRESLRQFLAEHSTFCPIHWRLGHVPLAAELVADHRLASDIITLPIDQRMDGQHIQRFVMLLERFFADLS